MSYVTDEIALKILLLKKGKTLNGLAKYLGISKTTLYRKLKGESDFYRLEMERAKEYCETEDMDYIFFAKKVS